MPCCRLTLPHESARNPGLGPKPEGDINEGAQHPSRHGPPRYHTGTHRSGCERLGSLCVRVLVRGSDRARSSEPDHPPDLGPERSGPSAETAGARDRSHPDRLPGSLWDKPPHAGASCPFDGPADSRSHLLRTALTSRNGASGSRTTGRTTDGLGHTCLASAFDFFWAAHDYRASDAGRARDQADGQHHCGSECPEACRHQHGLG